VILRPEGPVNADNVFLTAAEARDALNAGSGPRVFKIEIPLEASANPLVTLDAGIYGDSDVVMIGSRGAPTNRYRSQDWLLNCPGVVVEDGAILPMKKFESVLLALGEGSLTVPITASDGDIFVFNNVAISAAVSNPFDPPPPTPFFLVPNDATVEVWASGLNLFGGYARSFRIEQLGTDITQLSIFITDKPSSFPTSFFTGDGTISADADDPDLAFLSVYLPEDLYTLPEDNSSGLEYGSVINFDGRLANFSVNRFFTGGGVSARAPTVLLGPGQAGLLPALADMPDNFKITFTRDATAGADATVTASGSDLLLPTDPVSLAVGESVTIMRAPTSRTTTTPNPFWTTRV
jgi:hypothetical protein